MPHYPFFVPFGSVEEEMGGSSRRNVTTSGSGRISIPFYLKLDPLLVPFLNFLVSLFLTKKKTRRGSLGGSSRRNVTTSRSGRIWGISHSCPDLQLGRTSIQNSGGVQHCTNEHQVADDDSSQCKVFRRRKEWFRLSESWGQRALQKSHSIYRALHIGNPCGHSKKYKWVLEIIEMSSEWERWFMLSFSY